ncbi:MAG: 30S ribosomal protein S27e [Candidatus ainarchaeum sp.]|nr:30S ribosomal protein S27e [Candidatus ainarchaeum sp.]
MAKFIVVKCKCGNEQKIFAAPAMNVQCRVCNELLAQPTGGGAALLGKHIKDAE